MTMGRWSDPMKITVVVQSTLLHQLNWQRKASGVLSLTVTLLTRVAESRSHIGSCCPTLRIGPLCYPEVYMGPKSRREP